jgi:hypothetical protein
LVECPSWEEIPRAGLPRTRSRRSPRRRRARPPSRQANRMLLGRMRLSRRRRVRLGYFETGWEGAENRRELILPFVYPPVRSRQDQVDPHQSRYHGQRNPLESYVQRDRRKASQGTSSRRTAERRDQQQQVHPGGFSRCEAFIGKGVSYQQLFRREEELRPCLPFFRAFWPFVNERCRHGLLTQADASSSRRPPSSPKARRFGHPFPEQQ